VRLGDRLNGYEIITAPPNAGGGMSQWAFARKDGTEYFLKMFLAPKYPLDDGPGTPEAKARKRATCMAFERRHLEIHRRLDPDRPGGGNLVVPRAFFRDESTYVKVMDKVSPSPLPAGRDMSGRQILVLLRSLAFSLRLMHDEAVVHGDLKPDNVMVQRAGTDLLTAKLIDLDEAYVVGSPPSPEHIVGDPGYYSPELLRYIKEDERLPDDALGTPGDIFSLALLIHVFLVGDRPRFDRTHVNYPAEALLAGEELDTSLAPEVLRPLLDQSLSLVPSERPTIDDVLALLADVDADALVPTHTVDPAPPAPQVAPAPAPVPAAPRPPTRTPAPTPGGPPAPVRPSSPAPAGLRSTIGRRPRPEAGSPPDHD